MIRSMEKESISLLMEESMMESGKMVTCMEKESISMLMDMFMMVNGKMIRSMEKEFLSMLVEKRLMVCGIMMNYCCLHRYENSIWTSPSINLCRLCAVVQATSLLLLV